MPTVPILPADKSLAFRALVRKRGRPRKESPPPGVVPIERDHAKVPPRGQAPPKRSVQAVQSQIAQSALETAQQYAEREARVHAHKATELIRRSVADMETALNVLGEELPFAEGKDVRHLLEGYRAATAEMRKALGMREDTAIAGPKTLVSIQCVGDVVVGEPDQDTGEDALELPDSDIG